MKTRPTGKWTQNPHKRLSSRFWIFFTIGLAGCAGASVGPQTSNAVPVSASRPSTIWVYNFAVTSQEVTLNQGFFQKTYREMTDENQQQQQLDLAHQTAQALTVALVQQLKDLGFTAGPATRGQQVSGDNILIVDGAFTDISEGNRLRRMVIGLGLGQSVLDTEVHVYQMAGGTTQQIMDFTTHADSGEMPGALITGAPGAAAGGAAAIASVGVNVAAGGVKSVTSSTDFMAKRTANKSVAFMSTYFANAGWIPQSMVKNGDLVSGL
jgi:hypothetical protein